MEGIPKETGLDDAFTCFDPVTGGVLSSNVTTYYAGDPSHIPDQDYWNSQYRTLVTNPAYLPKDVHLVSLKTKLAGEQEWTNYASLLTDTAGKVPNPGKPANFGFSFSGWYTDEKCQNAFNFDTDTVKQDTPLYGVFTSHVDVDIPLATKVEVDASGKVTPAAFSLVSRTPQKLVVAQVSSEKATGVSALFPVASDVAKVNLDLKLGSRTTTLPIENGSEEYLGTIAAASPGKPSVLDGSIGLTLGGAQLNYQPGDDLAPLAKLTWVIQPAR